MHWAVWDKSWFDLTTDDCIGSGEEAPQVPVIVYLDPGWCCCVAAGKTGAAVMCRIGDCVGEEVVGWNVEPWEPPLVAVIGAVSCGGGFGL